VRRLNRNALTILAVIAGMVVVLMIVMLRPPAEGSAPAAVGAGDTIPARPTFLDQPAPGTAPPYGVAAGEAAGTTPSTAVPLSPGAPSTGMPPSAVPNGVPAYDPTMYAGVQTPGPGAYAPGVYAPAQPPVPAPPPRLSARELAYREALRSSVVAGAPPSAPPTDVAAGADAPGVEGEAGAGLDEPAAPRRPSAAHSPRRVSVEGAGSPYTLRMGAMIPALAVSGVNSDLGGGIVLAQVSRDVYDSDTQQRLLIPAGSRLVGAYEGRVGEDQARLPLAWQRVVFPDGRSVRLAALASYDVAGQAGLHDQVQRHRGSAFRSAVALSTLSAAAQLSQPRAGGGLYAAPSAGQVAAGALGQSLSELGVEMVRRSMGRPPTIIIRPGTPFLVAVQADLVFPGPYRAR
jgi:type IV secretion system protein VirB10